MVTTRLKSKVEIVAGESFSRVFVDVVQECDRLI
jgi:hypothetical protein